MSAPQRTPLYSVHKAAGARIIPFAGYEMPVQYEGVIAETKACRSHAGLFDVGHMGQFSLKGKGSLEALDKLVTNDLSKLQLGQAQYNILCQEDGGTVDDLVVYRREEDWTYICVNAANREKDFSWIQEHLPDSISLTDESDQTALIALQGPQAKEIAKKLESPTWVDSLKYYWATEASLIGIPTYVSRTGYTGEEGYEFYVPSSQAEKLWNTLMEVGAEQGLQPCGLGARDILRTEMGYALYGHELSSEITPLQAGLGWVVKLGKENFVGKSALEKEKTEGPKRKLKPLLIEDKRLARPGYAVVNSADEKVGFVSSGVMSPHLEKPIALAFIDKPYLKEESFRIEIRKERVPARVASLPFVKNQTK